MKVRVREEPKVFLQIEKTVMGILNDLFNREQPFLIQFAVLALVGFWYVESEKKWIRICYRIYQFLTVFSLTCLIFIEVIDVIAFKRDSSNLAERLCAATVTCIITMRTYLMLRSAEMFYAIEDKLVEFKKTISKIPEDVELIEKASERVVLATKVFYFCALWGIIFWALHPKLSSNRKLPFPIRLPIDLEMSPYYEILYVYLAIMLLMFTISVVATVHGFATFVELIKAHFGVVKQKIDRICTERDDAVKERRFLSEFNIGKLIYPKSKGKRKVNEKQIRDERTMEILKDAIKTQIFIYDEVSNFRRTQKDHLMLHILGIVFGICVVEATGLNDEFVIQSSKRLLIVGMGTWGILSICYFGETLEHKSCEVAEALYMIPWHEMDVKIQKVMLIMTIRSRRPCIFKAGGIIRLNLATYLNILRVSYNFMLLLRNTVLTSF